MATTEPLRLERTPEAPRQVPAEIAAGYDQLRQGNLPAAALAGLAALADSARPDAVEAQLRGDLARNPDSGALHFTLGNALAAQSRWHEAQSEYFEAHRLDPGSPEILYNLAVSIDRLGQPRVAAGFYTRALDAVRGQPNPPFDTAAVRRRLEELR